MTADTIRKLDMLKRIIRFLLDNLILPPIPRLTAAIAEITACITTLETAAGQQVAGSGDSTGGVNSRETTARNLRNYLKKVNRTARSLEEDHPDISPTFQVPRTRSYDALLAQAQAIIAAATPIQASFVEAGLPETFLTELQGLLTAFATATGRKQSGGLVKVLSTSALKVRANLGVKAATKADAAVRNHFDGNLEMLAAWAHARRIEKAPVRASSPAPTPPATPPPAPAQS
jgi:hypothetical protein